ncbi:beta-ketoacyl synthase [Gynuella sp.]|uniref:beta-ketoacyl synthase n=1 Tax=Gynuella sp. TaxID=2969146 RepID=UPI003D122ACC
MAKLPVIVSFGGMNAAGRSSSHHAYKRMVHEALGETAMINTWTDLANRMNIDISQGLNVDTIEKLKQGTLIRRINEGSHYNPDKVFYQRRTALKNGNGFQFTAKKSELPENPPENWNIKDIDNGQVSVEVSSDLDILVPGSYKSTVSSAGLLPSGFNPGSLYHSKHHPRGLQMTVYGASDAVNSLGISWETALQHVRPDQISVYAGSAISQMDDSGLAGLYQNPMKGNRISTKMMALTLPEMPADFINSYIINSVGTTGSNIGACATSLYNLRQGINDIQSGRSRIVIVGASEAPIVPEIIEGFAVMGALANDEQLRKLDNAMVVDNRRACRPFSTNAGFTMAESCQFMILMDDELALELGANIHGAVADVFVNADANKKSISAPGVGNYITVAKSAALARHLLGEQGVQRSFVQAHGTGTPQNRVTESHILNEVAQAFGITNWPVAAIKSYVGHSLGPAGLDQVVASLGVWNDGYIPGIKTIDQIADDVHTSHLDIMMEHKAVGLKGEDMLASIINSKGFGGNNASALILSPQQTQNMLQAKHGHKKMTNYHKLNEAVVEAVAAYDQVAISGSESVIYQFGQSVMDDKDVTLSDKSVQLSQFKNTIEFEFDNDYSEYL